MILKAVNNFYVLRDIRKRKYVMVTSPYSDIKKIPADWKFVRGQVDMELLKTISFERQWGNILTDYIPYTYTGLVSNHFIEVLKKEKVSGWSSVPVVFKMKRNEMINNYNFLFINGVVGPIDYKSGVIRERITNPMARQNIERYRLGISFDLDTWDGSDMFMSSDTSGYVFLTEKAKDVIQSLKCPNLEFKSLDQIEVNA